MASRQPDDRAPRSADREPPDPAPALTPAQRTLLLELDGGVEPTHLDLGAIAAAPSRDYLLDELRALRTLGYVTLVEPEGAPEPGPRRARVAITEAGRRALGVHAEDVR